MTLRRQVGFAVITAQDNIIIRGPVSSMKYSSLTTRDALYQVGCPPFCSSLFLIPNPATFSAKSGSTSLSPTAIYYCQPIPHIQLPAPPPSH